MRVSHIASLIANQEIDSLNFYYLSDAVHILMSRWKISDALE